MKKILAICGSTRVSSSNLNLIYAIKELSSAYFDIKIFKDIALLPHFNPDDDNENVIRARIKEYRNKTAAVADYYEQFNKVVVVKGEGTVEEIFQNLCKQIDLHKECP